MDHTAETEFDFRSPRFRDQALALARMTRCPLPLCRQELFIAEGDAVEAFMVLEQKRLEAAQVEAQAASGSH